MSDRLSISFSGAFYAWPYHAGVASYVQKNGLLGDDSRIYGTSSGAVPALLLACDVDVEEVGLPAGFAANDQHVNGFRTAFFHPKTVLRSYLHTFAPIVPSDGHRRANGRLHISVKQLPFLRKKIVSRFPSRQALIDVMAATIAVPLHSVKVAYRPRAARIGWCIDGGAESGVDDRPRWKTVRVSVWGGGGYDIRPSRPIPLSARINVQSVAQRMELFHLGYRDARHYFCRGQLKAKSA